jgi:hypothetical protein
MADAFVIESAGETAGIVVLERRGVRFYASDRSFADLDGKAFGSLAAARRAVGKLQQTRPLEGRPDSLHSAA